MYPTAHTDQLCGNQSLCFRYIDNTIPQLPKSKISSLLTIFCCCAAQFVSDLVENPEDKFCHDTAHLVSNFSRIFWHVLVNLPWNRVNMVKMT